MSRDLFSSRHSLGTPTRRFSFDAESTFNNERGAVPLRPLYSAAESSTAKLLGDTYDQSSEPRSQGDVSGWPKEASKIQFSIIGTVAFYLWTSIAILLCCAFLTLAMVGWKLDGEHVQNEHGTVNTIGNIATQASKLGPTIFPVLFTAIASTTSRLLARRLAEKGERLSILEMLIASRSMYAALEVHFYLRSVTVFSAVMVVLWAFSPLGGQASLRLLSHEPRSSSSTASVVYSPTGPMDWPSENVSSTAHVDMLITPSVNSLYGATLCAPAATKNSSEDIWGNVRIPRIDSAAISTPDSTGWRKVAQELGVEDYAALAGLPVSKTAMTANSTATFEVDYSYVDLECTNNTFFGPGDDSWKFMRGYPYDLYNDTLDANPFRSSLRSYSASTTSFFTTFDSRQTNQIFRDDLFATPRIMTFGANFDRTYKDSSSQDGTIIRNCSMRTVYVDARITCTSDTCRTTALRPSQQFADANPNIVLYRYLGYTFTQSFPFVLSPTSTTNSTQEIFLRGEDQPCGAGSTFDWTPFTQDVDDKAFGRRLALSVNTFVAIRQDPYTLVGVTPAPSDEEAWANGTDSLWPSGIAGDTRKARWTLSEVTATALVYRCDKMWFMLTVFSSLLLLALSIVAAVLRAKVKGPDIMGYVASQTYDNHYVAVPDGGSGLDAMQRARLLRDLRLRIADVRPDDQVGRVAFASESSALALGKLHAGRIYR